MNLYLQKESKWENANEKGVGSCDRSEERICTEKGEGVFIVKERKEKSVQVHWRTIKERVHYTFKVISNGICVFVGKKNSKKYMV